MVGFLTLANVAQTRDWQDRERGWNRFQRGMGTGKLARRIGAR